MAGKKIPFSINQNDARPLFNQVVDGFREAIISGYYVPGEKIPSSRDLCQILGVSRIVTQAALRQIADEGLVESRPRIGSVVRDRNVKQWKGRVVFVSPEGDEQYVGAVLATALRNRLAEAGYIFTQTCLPFTQPEERFDFSRLDVALAQSVDLIVAVYPRKPMLTRLRRLSARTHTRSSIGVDLRTTRYGIRQRPTGPFPIQGRHRPRIITTATTR